MKINILGGGPAGLYFALLMKEREPRHAITLFERDGPDDTFGWGIVFSERTLAFLKEHDLESYTEITRAAETWDNVDTVHQGQRITVRGNGFSGIGRLAFLNMLQRRCRALGVDLRFHHPVSDPADLAECDLLVGADGASSLVRQTWSPFFQPSVELRQNRYVWLGTPQWFDVLTMIFRQADAGLFIAHAYRFSPTASTFIVECRGRSSGRPRPPLPRPAGLSGELAVSGRDASHLQDRAAQDHGVESAGLRSYSGRPQRPLTLPSP